MSPAEGYLTDPVGDFLRYDAASLDAIFTPRTVALIGATEKENSVGRTVLWNLISNPFGGTVFPVNPSRPSVMGIKAYPSISEVPGDVDLAVIVTPAPSIPDIIGQCADAGVRGAIVISAGFKELGEPGLELERQILAHARRSGMRVIGPNCLGVMNPLTGLNATFAGGMARSGNVAFISQSGALCTAVLDWSIREMVGFSAFVSIGSMVDVDWGDLIDYLGKDSRTESIVIYMESIGSARSFLSAAREVALTKPIIVIKAGRTEAAAKAAASHTGSLTGSDKVLEAAFRRVGVLRVNKISELFSMAEALGKQPRPKGPRLSILTNAGGPGVLATDALIESGCQLAELSPQTFGALDSFLPPHWSRNNPVDILGDAGPERYAKALEIVGNDPNTDGLLVILTPQDMTDPTQTAEHLKPYAKLEKPLLASWMGGPDVQGGIDVLNRANIPTYDYPDSAARAFNYMYRYSHNLRALYENPTLEELSDQDEQPDRDRAASIIAGVAGEGRTILTEAESKALLAAYRIPVVDARTVEHEDAAVQAAEEFGFPVVLKLHSKSVTHKTDVGGVQLNLRTGDAVREAFRNIQNSVSEKVGAEHFQGVSVQPMLNLQEGYEIILGSSLDVQFGPVLLFGLGGQMVEVFKDSALGLPPLNANLARRMMEQTKIYTALKGVRGRKAVDLAALETLMVRFSQLIVEQPRIKESDINPLLASPERLIALDARFVLHEANTPEESIPKPAIRPYPIQYISQWQMQDGPLVTIRPIRPEDEALLIRFHETLSPQSVYSRYARELDFNNRTTHERLSRICFVDYDRRIVLVAEARNPQGGERQLLGVMRLAKVRGSSDGVLGLLISDQYQGRSLGTVLFERILDVARQEGRKRVLASMLPDNERMLKLCDNFGFQRRQSSTDERFLTAELDL